MNEDLIPMRLFWARLYLILIFLIYALPIIGIGAIGGPFGIVIVAGPIVGGYFVCQKAWDGSPYAGLLMTLITSASTLLNHLVVKPQIISLWFVYCIFLSSVVWLPFFKSKGSA